MKGINMPASTTKKLENLAESVEKIYGDLNMKLIKLDKKLDEIKELIKSQKFEESLSCVQKDN
jgi:hypothetical protein